MLEENANHTEDRHLFIVRYIVRLVLSNDVLHTYSVSVKILNASVIVLLIDVLSTITIHCTSGLLSILRV